MADFKDGDRVVALRRITDPATGDHPEFLLAEKGDILVVRDAAFETAFPWIVSRERDGNKRQFGVTSDEIAPLPNNAVRGAAEPRTLDGLVRLSESFTGTAKSKLEFLQGMGGRVVALVLEDCDGMAATIDRWGRVTWAEKPNAEGQPRREAT